MDGWNTTFLLGRPIFRGYVSFREGISYKFLLIRVADKIGWCLPPGWVRCNLEGRGVDRWYCKIFNKKHGLYYCTCTTLLEILCKICYLIYIYTHVFFIIQHVAYCFPLCDKHDAYKRLPEQGGVVFLLVLNVKLFTQTKI